MTQYPPNQPKIFCIGLGKTGTTSLEKALRDHGFKMGDQASAELLIHKYGRRNFNEIIKYCESAEAFQDAPFCFKYTFIPLDLFFPNAKFILTVRNSAEEWYNSLVNFHSKVHSPSGDIPTIDDLKNREYRYKGYVWDVRQTVYGIKEGQDPYDKEVFLSYYNSHNFMIRDYFKNKSNLLEINLSEKGSYKKMCGFIDKEPIYDQFPWKNKTSDR